MITFWALSAVVIGFMSLLIIWVLAKNNFFWAITEEGQARAVLVNGMFRCFFMSYKKRIFAKDDPFTYYSNSELELKRRSMNDEDKKVNLEKINKERKRINKLAKRKIFDEIETVNHPWDIVRNIRDINTNKPFIPFVGLLSGIRWIGIPPFAKVYSYRFRWTSIEEKADEEKGQTKKVPYTTDKIIDIINCKPDIFLITATAAETSELVPLDVKTALTAQVINPYKALFDAEKWLENVESQVGSKIRKFVGTKSYEDLIQSKNVVKTEEGDNQKADLKKEKLLSNENLEYILDSIKEEYGINITRVQILDVNPGSKKAEEFIEASTQKFVKKQKADGDIEEAKGFTAKYAAISKFKEGPDMYKHEQVRESNLRVYTSSGGEKNKPTADVLPTVVVDDVTKEDDKTDKTEEGK